MTRVFESADDLASAVGEHLGYSDWLTIDQSRIDAFAEVSGDHQWIHVDPERAAEGPFGTTVAHGYLTLSMVPALVGSLVDYAGWSEKVNYGSDKVRFPHPVAVGSRIRTGVEVLDVSRLASGLRVTMRVTVQVEGPGHVVHNKPALVAETLTLLA